MKKVNVEKSIESEKLVFLSHTGADYEEVIFLRGLFVFIMLFVFGILSFREDLGFIQAIFIIAVLVGLTLILWNVINNKKEGNKLLRIETDLSKSENREIIESGINQLNWQKKIDLEDQIRCIEVDEYEFLNYEITFLFQGDIVWFNYRSVRKGTNLKSILGKEVNFKNKERFENVLQKIRSKR